MLSKSLPLELASDFRRFVFFLRGLAVSGLAVSGCAEIDSAFAKVVVSESNERTSGFVNAIVAANEMAKATNSKNDVFMTAPWVFEI